MARYHINTLGEVRKCSARAGNCPYGDELEHYSSPDNARRAYERLMGKHFGPNYKVMDRQPLEDSAIPWAQRPWPQRQVELNNLALFLLDSEDLGKVPVRWEADLANARGRVRWIGIGPIITFSEELQIFSEFEAKKTVFHEVAHTLSYEDDGHGELWQAQCQRLLEKYQMLAPMGPGELIPARHTMTIQERKRIEANRLAMGSDIFPFVGRCPAGHQIFTKVLPRKVTHCPFCRELGEGAPIVVRFRRRND